MRQGITRKPRRAKFHRIERVMLVLVSAVIFAGCASVGHSIHADFLQRLEGIKSITVLPPNVAVYERAPDSSSYLDTAKSEKAQAILADALVQKFPLGNRFRLVESNFNHKPDAAADFKTLRPHSFAREDLPACLPTPVLALREAVNADAFLVSRALENDKSKEAARKHAHAMMTGLLLPPASAVVTPMVVVGTLVSKRFRQEFFSAGLAAIQICLVDTRTGDELWSYVSEFTGRDSLQDPAMVRDAVGDAFKSFQTVSHELKEQ